MRLPLTCMAALIAASPALAQDYCGGSGTGGQWMGGTQAASDITTADAFREQLALVLGENAYVGLFTLSGDTAVRIEAAGRGAGDPLIEVFDETGRIVASDDDSGGNGAAKSELDLGAGTYCVTMSSYEDAPMSAFLRVGRQDQEALILGAAPADTTQEGSCAAARPFGNIGGTQSASVDDTPFWSFTLDEPTALTITAQNTDADPAIKLFTQAQSQIAENDDFDGLNARIEDATPLAAGSYCIEVSAIDDTSLPIDLTITPYDPQAVLMALYARGDAAPPLDGPIAMTDLGVLQTGLRHDTQLETGTVWFTVDIPVPSLLLAEAIGAGDDIDPWLIVYDALGREVGQNDDAGDDLNSRAALRVDAGTHIIGVKNVGDDDARGFVQLVLERYVRAQ